MIHKEFRYPLRGRYSTEVQFNLSYSNQKVSVSEIQLHSKYKSKLYISVYLEYDHDGNEWKLCTYYDKEDKIKEFIKVRRWFEGTLTKEIVKKILEIKEEETPNLIKLLLGQKEAK